ncbi:MAG: hypothetical protein ACOYT4_02015 [Nanoarchaeota archaeon]
MRRMLNAPVQAYKFNENECLECNEAIFNPICHHCITREFKDWLQQYPKLTIKIIPQLDKFIEQHRFLCDGVSEKCVKCQRNNVCLCPYCFTEYLFGLLKQAKAGKKVLKEFLEMFNYDFDHTGYYKEGEKLGAF